MSAGLPAVLRALLPTPSQTQLLHACLFKDDACRTAWRDWATWAGDAKSLFAEDWKDARRLLPLLHWSLSGSDAAVDPVFAPYLRTAALYEELRARTYLRICGIALEALSGKKLDVTVLRGAALSATVYPDPGLRHCHDLDLLVDPRLLQDTIDVLNRNGFVPVSHDRSTARSLRLVHSSKFSVVLHQDLFRIDYYRPPLEDMKIRRVPFVLGGKASETFAPEDMLLHICGHVANGQRADSLCWVCDAWLLIEKNPELDWALFRDVVQETGLSLPVYAILRYMAEELAASIPQTVIRTLRAAALAPPTVAVEAALTGLRRGQRASAYGLLAAAPDWRTRLRVLNWMVFPTSACLSWSYRVDGFWSLPLAYLTRPWRSGLR